MPRHTDWVSSPAGLFPLTSVPHQLICHIPASSASDCLPSKTLASNRGPAMVSSRHDTQGGKNYVCLIRDDHGSIAATLASNYFGCCMLQCSSISRETPCLCLPRPHTGTPVTSHQPHCSIQVSGWAGVVCGGWVRWRFLREAGASPGFDQVICVSVCPAVQPRMREVLRL